MKLTQLKELDFTQPFDLSGQVVVNKETDKALVLVTDVDDEIEGLDIPALKSGKFVTTQAYSKLSDLIINELVIHKDVNVADDNDYPDISELDNGDNKLAHIKILPSKRFNELYKNLNTLLTNKI